ncbi:MAG: hypothetical protein Q3988_05290 [Gemella sp.]|nr:hypothetical protein [Gemella sp.]
MGASGPDCDRDEWLDIGEPILYGGKYPLILRRGLGLGQWTDTRDGATRNTEMIVKKIYKEFEYVKHVDEIEIYKKNIGRYRITFKLLNEIIEDAFKTPEKEIVILTLNRTYVGK